jgi:beta-phosphoglucomutase-like phosphatase (HAD superfamily)
MTARSRTDAPAVLLDVDGTLIDSNYQHALAWFRALREHGRIHSLVELHRHIGMGGDQLVESVAGEAFEREHGDAARASEKLRYQELSPDVAALEHASELIAALRDRGCDVVLATSGEEQDTQRYGALLGAEDLKYTTSADVETTKPAPDLNPESLEILPDARVEPSVAADNSGEVIQFERQGYFVRDKDSAPGKPVFNRTIGLRDTFAKEVGGKG